MKIIQLLPTISFGDAVGNDTLAIRDILTEQGYETGIFAENIDERLPQETAKRMDAFPYVTEEDIILYHASTGTKLNYDLTSFSGRKVIIYHNITPAHFFEGYSEPAVQLTQYGYDGVRYLSDKSRYCIADSAYNKQQLEKMGYQCPIDVCPIIIPFEDYTQEPDQKILEKYRDDGIINILFVGRIAPNKKQEDVIRAFYVYQKEYNPASRLFLVGSSGGMEKYEQQLKNYVNQLGITEKVIFSGHIKFKSILAYYRLADVFLCMSEHEGFCVPLVEAMFFDKPIISYNSTAIPETLAEGGLLLEKKDPYLAAAAIDRIVRDADLRKYISEKQKVRLNDFSYEIVRSRFLQCLRRALKITEE